MLLAHPLLRAKPFLLLVPNLSSTTALAIVLVPTSRRQPQGLISIAPLVFVHGKLHVAAQLAPRRVLRLLTALDIDEDEWVLGLLFKWFEGARG